MKASDLSLPDRSNSTISPLLLWIFWLMWLPFLIPVSRTLLQMPQSAAKYFEIANMALFIGIYGLVSWRGAIYLTSSIYDMRAQSKQYNWIIYQIALLGFLTILAVFAALTQGAQALGSFIFVSAAFAGWPKPVRLAVAILGGLMLLAVVIGLATATSGATIIQAIFLIPVVGGTTMTFTRTISINHQLRIARREVVQLAITEERLRFARDLHDLLGHTLSLIALKSELAGHLIREDPRKAQQEIRDIEKSARTALLEVREAVSGYRESTLANELQRASELLAAAGIQCTILDNSALLPAQIDGLFAWVVREGITNIVRHSKAKQCGIAIEQQSHAAILSITDDGHGNEHTIHQPGNGLRGIAERTIKLNGQYAFGFQPGQGFHITIQVPMQANGNMQSADSSYSSIEEQIV